MRRLSFLVTLLALTTACTTEVGGSGKPADAPGSTSESMATGPDATVEASPSPFSIDGRLDCTGDARLEWHFDPAADATGLPTSEAAVREALREHVPQYGEVARITTEGRSGAIVVDGREVVVATAREAPEGEGWLVYSVSGCPPDE